jgi:superfamily II DNA or RNA helicase
MTRPLCVDLAPSASEAGLILKHECRIRVAFYWRTFVKIIKDKAVLLKVKHPNRITTVIPKSKQVSEHEVIVHWGIEELRVLRNLKIKVPNPITTRYDWPGKYKPFEHQRKTAEFLTMNQLAFCFSEQGCVDSETEYLSPEGWKKISEYREGKVAQYHPHSRSFEFVEPDAYVKLPCRNMVKLKTKNGIDQMLSPEHRVLLHDNKNPEKHVVMSADEVLLAHDRYHLGIKNDNKGSRKLGFDKVAFSSMSIPTALDGCGGEGLSYSNDELRLMVAVIADGHFGSPNTARCVVRLKKQRKKFRLRQLLTKANVKYSKNTCPSTGYAVFTFNAMRNVKVFDNEFWEASKSQLKIIADEVLRWDGCITRGKRFSTYNKQSADFVQYVFVSTGHTARVLENTRERRGKVETEYVVQIRDTQNLTLRSPNESAVPCNSTDGFKYCFTVPSTFLVFRRNGCVFASGNTGKTGSAIWAADYLMKAGIIKRALVVCPLSIMDSAWRNDLFSFAMHRRVDVAHGSKKKRVEVIQSKAEFVIINYDGIGTVRDELQAGGFDLIIADEATYLKNPSTTRWKMFKSLLKPETWVWLMTGTPAAQSPMDAYGLAKIVNPAAIPKYKTAFQDKVMFKITQFKWIPKKNANQIVHEVLQPAIRYSKEDCLDLPEQVYVTRDVELTKQQTAYYQMLVNRMAFVSDGETVSAPNAAVHINKLLQISSGTVYTDGDETLEFDVTKRYKVLKEVIDESVAKVLVFIPFRQSIEVIAEMLNKDKIASEKIHGGISAKKRTEVFKRFQEEDDPRVLLIQPQSAAHGVTLTAANTVVWWGPTFSLETFAQANARVHRQGQINRCTVVQLQGSPVERHAYNMLNNKIDIHSDLISLYKKILD